MKTPISMWQVGVAASLLLLGQLAAAGPVPDISTAGFGDAKFGMDIEAVERALGRVLVMPKGKSKAQVRKMECSYASVSDLPGVALRFENNQLQQLRVAATGADSRPLLINGLDQICGIALDDALTQLDKLLRKQVGPMETSITPAAYRRRVVPVLARRVIGRLIAAGPGKPE